jgi:hypothetical protein
MWRRLGRLCGSEDTRFCEVESSLHGRMYKILRSMVAACLGHASKDIASNATRLEILNAWRRLGRLTHA